MARIRTVKPTFFTDEDLSKLNPEIHLFAAALLCQADDEGYFPANPRILIGAIFPTREYSLNPLEYLTELSRSGWIRLGRDSEGKLYGQVVNFLKHQKVDHPSKSLIKNLPLTWDKPLDNSPNPREDSLKTQGSLAPEKEKEKEKEKEGTVPDFDREEAVSRIISSYPKPEFGALTTGYVLDAIRFEAKDRGLTEQAAADFILENTTRYVKTLSDPKFAPKAASFFENRSYTPPKPLTRAVAAGENAVIRRKRELGLLQ